jgi:hypothetical protein
MSNFDFTSAGYQPVGTPLYLGVPEILVRVSLH